MGTIDDTAEAVVDDLRRTADRSGCSPSRLPAVPGRRPSPHPPRGRTVGRRRADRRAAAADNPLTRETKAALYAAAAEGVMVPRVLSVSAGLGSRDVGAAISRAIFDWAAHARSTATGTTRSSGSVIRWRSTARRSDVRHRAPTRSVAIRSAGSGPSRPTSSIATIVGEVFDKYVQAYPRYGSEKKGLPTTYYLTIADDRSTTHAELDRVDLVPLHDVAAFGLGEPAAGLVDGGTLFLQSELTDPRDLGTIPRPPGRRSIRRRIRVTALDTAGLARAARPRRTRPADAGRRARRRLPAGLALRRRGAA
jgi:pyruvate-ferredoxin/flavodoxin oxidoreductase